MKLRKYFTLVLHLLLVFGFCLPLIAEEIAEDDLPSIAEIAEMMNPKTLDEAKTALEDLKHYYDMALAITLDAKFAHVKSEQTVVLLQSAFDLKTSEKNSTLKETAQGIYDGIKAVSLDPVDIISDVAATVFKGIKDGWNYNTLRKEKNNVERALNAQKTKSGELEREANSAEEYSKFLLASKHKVFKIKKALESPLTYSLSCPSYALKGRSFVGTFEVNRSIKWVKYYAKYSNQSGLGTLIYTQTSFPDGYPKVSECTYVVSEGNFWDEYVVTAVAKLSSSGEEVSDSCTITLVEEGIYFNKKQFTEGKNETLEIMVIFQDLYMAYLYIGGKLVHDSTFAKGTHVVTLSDVIDSSYSVGEHSLMISGYIGQNRFTCYGKITVLAAPGYYEKYSHLSAYGTYEAKVVESDPIKKVEWSIKEPGKEWKTVKTDKVNGGYSSSLSYSVGSTSGRYEVKTEVHFETNATTYKNSFSVW